MRFPRKGEKKDNQSTGWYILALNSNVYLDFQLFFRINRRAVIYLLLYTLL